VIEVCAEPAFQATLCKTTLSGWKDLMGPDFSPFLFPTPSDPGKHLKSVRKPWTTALKKAKVEYFRLYDLRANFASRLSAAGAPHNLVAGVIGHSTPSIVQTYAKVVDEYRRDAIKKLERYRQEQLEKATASAEIPATTERSK
jgi:integrase